MTILMSLESAGAATVPLILAAGALALARMLHLRRTVLRPQRIRIRVRPRR